MLYAETINGQALEEVLNQARTTGNDEVVVYGLDALARLAAEGRTNNALSTWSGKPTRLP